jgi:hypothetical protein
MTDTAHHGTYGARLDALFPRHEVETETAAMFSPRYLRHFVGKLLLVGEASNGEFRAQANYAVWEVVGGQLKRAERRCVYDNLLVDNTPCLPV